MNMIITGNFTDIFYEVLHPIVKKMKLLVNKMLLLYVVLFFYVHSKHLRSSQDGQLT